MDWRVFVGGALLCLFGWWALSLVREASELRLQVDQRVELLVELQASQRAVMTNGPDTPMVRTALLAFEDVARAAAQLPAMSGDPRRDQQLQENAAALLQASAALRAALEQPGERDEARVALVLAVDGLATSLFATYSELARALDRLWMSVLALASASVVVASVALLLFLRARERRLAAEAMGRRLGRAVLDANEAREAALAADRAKSTFLATVSHEIRTPMTAILGTVELLGLTELDEHQRDCVAVVNSGGQALLNIINDVLDLSRIEAGRIELSERSFDLFGLLDALVLLFATAAEGRGLALTLFIASEVPREVTGDPTRLRQVLVNLVGNALKFTEQGEVGVRVSVERGGALLFEVDDTGPGLRAQDTERVFEAFSQVDDSSSRRHGGTGLGLAICKRLVEAMRGEIGVRSTFGEGARFWFTVRMDASGEAVGRLERQRHLLVGEGPGVRVIADQLKAWGQDVVWARGAAEARTLLAGEEAYELVIIDLTEEEARALAVPSPALKLRVGSFQERREIRGGLVRPVRPTSLLRLLGGGGPTWPPGLAEGADGPGAMAPVKRRVLVVDDNATNRLVVGRLLTALGCEVSLAEGGADALEQVRSRPVDLVLMDYDMPGMDGLAATEHIRGMGEPLASLPIVGLTGHVTPEARQAGLDAGMNDCLAKPVRLVRLKQLLVELGMDGG